MSVTGGSPLHVDLANEVFQQLEYWTPTPQLDDDTKKSSKQLCAYIKAQKWGLETREQEEQKRRQYLLYSAKSTTVTGAWECRRCAPWQALLMHCYKNMHLDFYCAIPSDCRFVKNFRTSERLDRVVHCGIACGCLTAH